MLAPVFGDDLTIFNYHRIRPDEPGFTTRFDDGVYGPTASQFFEQMRWLNKNRTIISEQDIIDGVRLGGHALKQCVLITFDDGYRDNFDLAYPILKRLGIPAIFFIPTKAINTRQLGWWDIIAYLIKRCKKQSITVDELHLPLDEHKSHVIRLFQQKMKLEKYDQTTDLLTKLSDACEVDIPSLDIQDRQLMTWNQIRTVSNDNIAIGSHTHSHLVLSTLGLESQKEEMLISKTFLEHELGQPVQSIAYPVGGRQHFTEQTQRIAAETGYELGFSFLISLDETRKFNPFNMTRISGPKEFSMVPAISVFPKLFCPRR